MSELAIRLEKNEYLAGEEVEGTLIISVENDSKYKNFRFYAQGKEDPLKSVPDYHDDSKVTWSWSGDQYRYSPPAEKVSNIFFFKDLLESFHSLSTGLRVSNDGTLELQKGQYKIPFHFTIPTNSLESYEGSNVSIGYELEATVNAVFDRVQNRQTFTVSNPNCKQVIEGKTILFFGKPTISGKNWKEQVKRGLKATLTLDGSKYSFSPGETVRGRVTVSAKKEDRKRMNIKKAEITLSVVEDRVKLTEITSKVQMFRQQIPRNKIEGEGIVIFEILVNEKIKRKRNYIGKLTAYYWLLEATLDMGITHHIHQSTVIEVA